MRDHTFVDLNIGKSGWGWARNCKNLGAQHIAMQFAKRPKSSWTSDQRFSQKNRVKDKTYRESLFSDHEWSGITSLKLDWESS